jgi:hypothetical protein
MCLRCSTSSRTTLVLLLLTALSCGGDSGGGSGPEETTVFMTGDLDLPSEEISPDSVTVGFGDRDAVPDSSGAFEIEGNAHVTGLAIAYEDTVPLLLSALADPTGDSEIALDVHSTAVALVFMCPLVCISGPDAAGEVLQRLETLPEVSALEDLLETKLASDPRILATEDENIAEAVAEAVVAFVNSYPDIVEDNYPGARALLGGGPAGPTDDNESTVCILPTTQTSGHELTHIDGDQFQITNAYGRWVYCLVEAPPDTFIMPPNGSMLDFVWDDEHLPWAPSEKTFTLDVAPGGDTVHVWTIGYGFNGDPDNSYSRLTSAEAWMAHDVGMWTIIFEYCGNMISVVLNSINGVKVHAGLYRPMPKRTQLLGFLTDDAGFMHVVEMEARNHNYMTVVWMVAKKVMYKIFFDQTFRNCFEDLAGYVIPTSALAKLKAMGSCGPLTAPIVGVLVGNNLTNAAKTLVGLMNSRWKTEFKVWRIVEDFGTITGTVSDKDTGLPLEGVLVELLGDWDNPIPGHVTTMTTGTDGGFHFDNVTVGEKSVRFSKSGYESQTKEVTVVKKTVHTLTVDLERAKGTVQGDIVNLVKKAYRDQVDPGQDTLFTREATLFAHGQVGGGYISRSYFEFDGVYSLELEEGTWWIGARHEAYYPDSVGVEVESDQTVRAPRSLAMAPHDTMTVTLSLQALGSPVVVSWSLAGATSGEHAGNLYLLAIAGGQSSPVTEEMDFIIDLYTVQSASDYALGTAEQLLDPGSGYGGFVGYVTERVKCDRGGGPEAMVYGLRGEPDEPGCDCGITDPGLFYFTEFGLELGDVIAGSIVGANVNGFMECECAGVDTNSDGIPDDWSHVTCTLGEIDADFRVIVGSLYTKVTPTPGALDLTRD